METEWNAGAEQEAPRRQMRVDPDGSGVQVLRLSHRHEAIMNWMLINPDRNLRECADHFDYSQAWLSSVIHSDLFQLALRERQVSIQAKIADSIPAKLRTLADVGLDKLTTQVEESEDPRFILDATDKILHRMGFAPASARNPAGSPGAVVAQQNNFFLTEKDLTEARALMGGQRYVEARVLEAGAGEDE